MKDVAKNIGWVAFWLVALAFSIITNFWVFIPIETGFLAYYVCMIFIELR